MSSVDSSQKTRLPRAWRPPLLAALTILGGLVLSQVLSIYTLSLATTGVLAAISLIGLGVVTGTAGMIALCQLSFAAIGAWTVSWLTAHDAPGGLVLWIWLGGLVAAAAGVVLGLPALRLRGVNLAVVTLGFAAAVDLTLTRIQFPGTLDGKMTARPGFAPGDRMYFLFSVVVMVVCAVLTFYLQASRIGASWKSVAFSERATASAGVSVPAAKLGAFAVGAFTAGVSGGLLCGQIGAVYATSFTTVGSLATYVLAVVVGSHLVDMAILGGVLWVAVPELLRRLGLSQDLALVVFGLLGIQSIASGSNLGTDVRSWWWRRTHRAAADPAVADASPVARSAPLVPLASGGAPVLVVEDLGVAFGAITALSGVDLQIAEGTITGLIGPNGAGKSTFIDAVTGFLPQHTGVVRLDGRDLAGLEPAKRATQGLRRTYQQDRVPATLTVGAYARFVAGRGADRAFVRDVLDHFGAPDSDLPLERVDAGTRRLIEVAAQVAARPRVLLLDEPAAGVSHHDHERFAQQLLGVTRRWGVSLLLIEHDLDLVRAVCTDVAVLDFGSLVAHGPQAEVLADPSVQAAYMGDVTLT